MKALDLSRVRHDARSTITSASARERHTKSIGTPRGTPRGTGVIGGQTIGSSSQYHDASSTAFFGLSTLPPIPGWKRCAVAVTVRACTSDTEHVAYDAVTEVHDGAPTAGSDGHQAIRGHARDKAPDRPEMVPSTLPDSPRPALSTSGTRARGPTTPRAVSSGGVRGSTGLFARATSGEHSHRRLSRTGSGMSSVRSGLVTRARSPGSSAASYSTRTSLRRRGVATAGTAARYDANAENHLEDMAGLHRNGLHTTLWMATQDGSIEVRDAADPAYLMAIVGTGPTRGTGSTSAMPTLTGSRTDRRFVTTLAQIGGNRVVAGLSDGMLTVYDATTLSEVTQVRAHHNAVTCLSSTTMPTAPSAEDGTLAYPRATVLLTGSADCTIAKWDGVTLQCLGRLSGNRRPVTALAVSAGGCFAFSGSDDGAVRFWSLLGNEEIAFSTEERQLLRRMGTASPRTGRGARARRTDSTSGYARHDTATDTVPLEPTRRLFDHHSGSQRGSRRASIRGKASQTGTGGEDDEARLLACTGSTSGTGVYGQLAGSGTDISPVRHRPPVPSTDSDDDDGEDDVDEGDQHQGRAKLPRRRRLRRVTLQKAGLRAGRTPAALVEYVDDVFKTFRHFAPVTATSSALAIAHVASYDDPHLVHWPVENVHKERISALAVVQDRLLLTAGRDGTAMVLALPSGEVVGGLPVQRSVPLTAIVLDDATCRALLGFSDGSMAGFDLTQSSMPQVFDVRPPTIAFSSTFVSLNPHCMQRLGVLRQAASLGSPSEASGAVTVVAEHHRTQVAHGPSHSYSTYRLGEPSLREIKLAMDVAERQQRCLQAVRVRAMVRTNMTVEQMEGPDLHHCGRTMQKQHERRLLACRLAAWQRWLARRHHLRALVSRALTLEAQNVARLRQHYYTAWYHWRRGRRTDLFEYRLFLVDHRGTQDDPARALGLEAGHGQLTRTVHERTRLARRDMSSVVARQMAASLRQHLCRRFFTRWLTGVREARACARRELAFNRLLLTFQRKEDTSFDEAAVVRRALVHRALCQDRIQRLLPVLEQGNARRCGLRLMQRHFNAWKAVQGLAEDASTLSTDATGEFALVEPLSRLWVRADEVRRRYFVRWWSLSRGLDRLSRLEEEKRTLQAEWSGMSDVTCLSASRTELIAEEKELKESVAHMTESKAQLADEEAVLLEKLKLLQRQAALHTLTFSFHDYPIAGFEARVMPSTAAGGATTARRSSTATSLSTPVTARGGDEVSEMLHAADASLPTVPPLAVPTAAEAQRAHDDAGEAVYAPLFAVLRALKGSVLQCVRDDKPVAAAHQLTLSLPLVDPTANEDGGSVVGGSAAKPPPGGSSRSPRLGSSFSSLQGSLHAGTPRSSLASTTAGRTGSGVSGAAATMWAAHPPEPTYEHVAAAFDGITRRVLAVLDAARTEVAPLVSSSAVGEVAHAPSTPATSFRDTSAAFGGADSTLASSPSVAPHEGTPRSSTVVASPTDLRWVRAIPAKTRKELLSHVLKLIALSDSFVAHSEWPVATGSPSLSVRSSLTLSRLPLTCLCSPPTAAAFVNKAPELLMLFSPGLWSRQRALQEVRASPTALPLGTAPKAPTHRRINSTMSGTSATSTAATTPRAKANPLKTHGEGTKSRAPQTPPLHLSVDALRRASASSKPNRASSLVGGGLPPPRSNTRAPASAIPTGSVSAAAAAGAGGFSAAPRRDVEPFPPPSAPQTPHRTAPDTEANTIPQDTPAADPFNRSYGSVHSCVSTPRSSVLLTPRVSVPAGSVTKPYLGFRVAVSRDAHTNRSVIAIREVAPTYINSSGVEEVGPAVSAGLQAGDVLSRFAGYAVTDLAAFNTIVARHVRSGLDVPVVVQRQSQTIQAKVHVGVRNA